jgi:hypothetical protein
MQNDRSDEKNNAGNQIGIADATMVKAPKRHP